MHHCATKQDSCAPLSQFGEVESPFYGNINHAPTLLASQSLGESSKHSCHAVGSGGGAACAQANCVARTSLSLSSLHHRLSRPHEHRRRGVADAHRPRLRRPGCGSRRRNVFRGLPGPRNSGRTDCRTLERAPLDFAHHDFVGHHHCPHGVHPHVPRFLCRSLSRGRGGSWFLSRNHRLYLPLVSSCGPRESGRRFFRSESTFVRHRLSARRFVAGYLLAGATGLALVIHSGRGYPRSSLAYSRLFS